MAETKEPEQWVKVRLLFVRGNAGDSQQTPEWSGRGRQPIHRKAQSAAQRVDRWAAAQPSNA